MLIGRKLEGYELALAVWSTNRKMRWYQPLYYLGEAILFAVYAAERGEYRAVFAMAE